MTNFPSIYRELLATPHLLIAGATGSGKSVLINGMLTAIESDETSHTILIDPKMVELSSWYRSSHCIGYASTGNGAVQMLKDAVRIMENRYKEMASEHVKKYANGPLYVIIDEYADLIVTNKKDVQPLCLRLAQLGRAADVHLILATQRPTANIVTGDIKVNMDNRIALHVPTQQDSRNIIGSNDAVSLPRYGNGLWLSPDGLSLVEIPLVPDDIQERLDVHLRNTKIALATRITRRLMKSEKPRV